MKRDMELVRKILLAVEAAPGPELDSQPTIKGYTDGQVNYHLQQLAQAGLVTAVTSRGDNMVAYDLIGLTWKGHEFLDAARDETIWQKAKTSLGGRFDSVSLAVLQQLLISFVKSQLGLP